MKLHNFIKLHRGKAVKKGSPLPFKHEATARRMPQQAMEEYDEEEPSMKFSSAFVVVLLLHVTAFGGIWAFDKIKDHRGGAPFVNLSKDGDGKVEPASATPQPESGVSNPLQKRGNEAVESPSSSRLTPVANHETSASAEKVKGEAHSRVLDSGTVYTTVKGDNPVTIAHHFAVSYDDLLKLNNIEDPKKLQIGQKLHIPGKRKLAAE